MAKGDHPWRHSWSGGTTCSATNGPGGPAAAAMHEWSGGTNFGALCGALRHSNYAMNSFYCFQSCIMKTLLKYSHIRQK